MQPFNMGQPNPLPKIRRYFEAVMQNYDVRHTLVLNFAIVYEGA